MKDINLISGSGQKKSEDQDSGRSKKLGAVILAVLLTGMLGYGGMAFLQERLEKKEAAIKQKIKEAEPIVELKRNIAGRQEKINKLSGIVDLLNAQTTINTRIFEGIASVMPEKIFIVNYAVSQQGELNILGKAKDMDSIAYFVHELKNKGLFANVYLSNVSNVINNNANAAQPEAAEFNFSILLTLKK